MQNSFKVILVCVLVCVHINFVMLNYYSPLPITASATFLKENNNSTLRIFPIGCNHNTVSVFQRFVLSAYDPEGNKYSLLLLTERKVN